VRLLFGRQGTGTSVSTVVYTRTDEERSVAILWIAVHRYLSIRFLLKDGSWVTSWQALWEE
jgi:hypothetical protein